MSDPGAKPWQIDGDVSRAGTIDARLHHDPAAHAHCVDRVFARSWQLVPEASSTHRITPFTLGEGSLDEPLVLVRDGDSERVLSNVCTHRGALLAEAPGDAKGFRCRYHGRRFGLDGALTSCPGFEGARDFPRPTENLRELELHRVGPLAFTSIAPGVPFDDWAAPLRETLAEYRGESFTFDPGASADYDLEAGWAVYCENYLEGFHVPFVHPGLNESLDFGRYRTELLPHGVRQLGFASGEEPRLRHAAEDDLVADYLWLYPNLMVNAYAWGISVNVTEPTGPGRTRVRYLRWVVRPDLVGQGAGGALDEVEAEDQAVVLSVQRGVRSRLYPGGRFSPEHETGPHHFERMLGRDLDAPAGQQRPASG